jgi:uncharacterized protein (TIGR02391 family)
MESLMAPPFPTLEEAAGLPVDELALRLLHVFARDMDLDRAGLTSGLAWPAETDTQLRHTAILHLGEAWDWLMHRGLIAFRPDTTSVNGWGYVTERGHAAARDSRGLARIQAEARIDVDLHPLLERRIRRQFLLGEYELAVFAAMREVEIRVRDLGGFGSGELGVSLMRKAFHETTGPLTDPAQVVSEQQATGHLFAGAIGVFKNPSSHRQVDFSDPTVASEAVLLADLLLRMLDAAEQRIGGSSTT